MNQEKILQSNLLDIIFENRNKAYGAYDLRVAYNVRMNVALFSTMVIFTLLSFFVMSKSSGKAFIAEKNSIVPEGKITAFHPWIKPEQSATPKMKAHLKKAASIDMPPKIVAFININKLPATAPEFSESITGIEGTESDLPQPGNNSGNTNEKIENDSAKLNTPKPGKREVLEEADVMPQYPGGLKALLIFLKKNIQFPEELDQEEVSVTIRFVVNYNGQLNGFDVIQSGGATFDNEVLRVLKKMPLWIPGKSNGENVSVYYIVPVKFSNAF